MFEASEEKYINIENKNKEHNIYPVNTFETPTHIPGSGLGGLRQRLPLAPLSVPDCSKYDIVKASQYGYFDRVKHLVEVEKVNVREPDTENVTVLHWAAINNRLELVQYFITKGAIVDQPGGHLNATPLHWAIRQGLLDMTILLMRFGADPTLQDSEGLSGLHLAAQFGHTSVAAYLIAKGIDVDLIDQNGMTPLMWATYRCFGIDPTRLIINFGAAVNFADAIHKNTALHWGIVSSNTNVIRTLLEAGASLDCVNANGQTPLDLALERKNNYIIHVLKEERFHRGVGRPGFVNSLLGDPNTKRKIIMFSAAAPLFTIGLILEYSPWWIFTLLLLFILASVLNASLRLLMDHKKNPLAVGLYLGTKAYMFSSLFIYFWPLVNYVKIHILFWLNTVGVTYCFYKSWWSDPGFIKTSPSKQKKEIVELAEAKMLNDFSKFCTTCLTRRPIRSKHCSVCDRCVARMDHHCPWIDNCVGLYNHAYFIGFLFCLMFMNLWYMWGTILYYNAFCGPFNEGILIAALKAFQCAPWVSWGFAMASFHSVWVSALLVFNVYQVFWLGMTTNERMNSARYKHFHDSSTGDIKSPFNNGLLQNIADFFNISICGFVKPSVVDWMNEYDLRDFQGPQSNWRRYQQI